MTHTKGKSRAPVVARLTHFRDTRTGRFVKQSTWTRSKAHGGTRYKRQIEKEPRPIFQPKPPPAPPPPPPQGPNVGKVLTWVELMDLANEKKEVSIFYNNDVRTPGRVGIADFMMERRDMRNELESSLGTSWQVVAMWNIDTDTEEAMDAHATEPITEEEEE